MCGRLRFVVGAVVLCIVISGGFIIYDMGGQLPVSGKGSGQIIVIDPGHGGADPGKVGINNALEKDINLAIGLILRKKLTEAGYKVVMTRDSDTALSDGSQSSSKMSDLNKRIQIMNSSKAAVVVSIHQNSFVQESCKGAQVFYQTTSEEGKKFAEIMQEQLRKCLDSENSRVAKANSDYYVLKKSEPTAIIVESGFLSNSQEAALLVNEEYQEKVADAIIKGVESYLLQ